MSNGRSTIPATLSKRRGVVPSGTEIAPELALTHLAVAGATSVRLRTRTGWQSWRKPSGCPGGPDGSTARPHLLIPANGVVDYQVRGEGVSVVELNTVDGPKRAVAAAEGTLPMGLPAKIAPKYLSRAAWGADESYRFDSTGAVKVPPTFFKTQTLTVHHSGEDVPVADQLAHVRGIYYTQAITQDYGDIGYQLLIDSDGRVYEGCYSDPDAIPVFGPALTADGLPQMVNGAHVGGFNAGNIGICLLGNFMNTRPTNTALSALTIVLARLAASAKLDPQGTTDYENPISGAAARIATIATHRDWHKANSAAGATLCPGDFLYGMMPVVRQAVAAKMRNLPAMSLPTG
ncbi:peptidoglycan recognition family protein [Actinoplanes sp. NPDC051859]|uniref:peptidoglycan recognition family protein n=1 Tax=Actinoplanes sp. NPDC051859 TaxID=3363909 RepID=UPI0037B70942